ncbi:DUF1476 domain-containing protein [Allorhizobium undicola]|uniref:DUF1476 domain-containing protein n=1 Tax=Allorhizobium undicola TaxID=78527 RepID=UPI00048278F8|nr:DUF1476 domain-containing protein [Allorhizobium undicola]
MKSIAQRARTLEAKFAHDQEVHFKVEAQRNKLMGLWAASLMNRQDADTYADDLCLYGVEQPEGVLNRLKQDLEGAGVRIGEDVIHSQMVTLLRQAHEVLHTNGH